MAFFVALASIVKECEFEEYYLLDNMLHKYISECGLLSSEKRTKRLRASFTVWRSCRPHCALPRGIGRSGAPICDSSSRKVWVAEQ